MTWNVFYDGPNNEIETWNIFQHISFCDEVETALAEEVDKEKFERRLHSSVIYYFWSKSEYEVIVAPWPCYISRVESQLIKNNELPRYRQVINVEGSEKISVYDQLVLNWDVFVNYCWGFKAND